MIAAVVLAITCAGRVGDGSQETRVNNASGIESLVLVSNDRRASELVSAKFRQGMTAAELTAALPTNRYRVSAAKGEPAAAIDIESGLMKDAALRNAVVSAFYKHDRADWTVTMNELSPEEQRSFVDVVEQFLPSQLRPKSFDMKGAVFGLSMSYRVELENAGKKVTVQLSALGDGDYSASKAAMEKGFLPQVKPKPDDLAVMNAKAKEDWRDKSRVELHLYGSGRKEVVKCMLASQRAVAAFLDGLESARREMLEKLLPRLKFGGFAEGVPRSGTSSSDIPEGFRKEVLDHIRLGSAAYGFGSPADAESFFLNCSGFNISIGVGLAHCDQPGDPARGVPAVFGIYEFAILR